MASRLLTTNRSNNYGPYRFPETLIPLVIAKAMAGEPLPIYGEASALGAHRLPARLPGHHR